MGVESEARRRLLSGLLALVIGIAGIGLLSSRSAAREEAERLREKLEISRGDAGAEIEALEGEVEQLTAALAAAEADREELRARTQTDADTVATLEETLAELRAEQALLKEVLAGVGENGIEFMPELTGVGVELATEFAETAGAELVIETAAPGNVIARPGAIIDQLPLPGTVVIPGTVVWIRVFSP